MSSDPQPKDDLLDAAKHWMAVHNCAMSSRKDAEEAFNSGLITRAALRLQNAIAKAETAALPLPEKSDVE